MSKPLRVLIVEDSIPDAELLLYELRRGDYEPIYEIVDTPEAMSEALDRQSWDLVLADYVLPNFGGLAALELLKARGLDIPFIIVSGQIGEDIAVAAMKAGANDYLMKGHLARLVPAVERELAEAEVRRQRRKAEEERDRLMEQLRNVNEQIILSSIRLQDQTEEMEAIVEALAEAIVVYGPAGEILRLNFIAENTFGFSAEERKRPFRERWALLRAETEEGKPFPFEEAPPVKALRGETVRGVVALLHRASDGKPIWLSASAAPIRTPSGQIRGAVCIFTDITALRGSQGASSSKA